MFADSNQSDASVNMNSEILKCGLSQLSLQHRAVSSCILPLFDYMPPSFSEYATNQMKREMEMEHERSLALDTQESMLDEDDILMSKLDDQLLQEHHDYAQFQLKEIRSSLDDQFIENSLVVSEQSSCLALLEPRPSTLYMLSADAANQAQTQPEQAIKSELVECKSEKQEQDESVFDDEDNFTAPTRSSTGLSAMTDFSAFAHPLPETNTDVFKVKIQPKSEKKAPKIAPKVIKKTKKDKNPKKPIKSVSLEQHEHNCDVAGTQQYKCSECGKIYESSRALGGHFSKSHPGQSNSYRRKMEVRKAREQLRAGLALAKDLFIECGISQYNDASNRQFMTKLRDRIIELRPDSTKEYSPAKRPPKIWFQQLRDEICAANPQYLASKLKHSNSEEQSSN